MLLAAATYLLQSTGAALMRPGLETLQLGQLILQGVKAVHKGEAVVLQIQLCQGYPVLGRRQTQPMAEVHPSLPCKWPAFSRWRLSMF